MGADVERVEQLLPLKHGPDQHHDTHVPATPSAVPLRMCPAAGGRAREQAPTAPRRVAVLDERVEDDEPPCATEARHVGVLLPRPPARVRDENLRHRHTCAHGERPQRPRQLLVGERREAVEERLEHDRRDEREHDDERRAERGCRHRPPRWEPACEADEPDHRDARENDPDREPLRPVERPAARRLGREAPRVSRRYPDQNEIGVKSSTVSASARAV